MSRRQDKSQSVPPKVAIFTAPEGGPFGAAIAEGLGNEATHALAHGFELMSADLVGAVPEGLVGRLVTIAVRQDQEDLQVPEIEADMIAALVALAAAQGRVSPAPVAAAGGQSEADASQSARSEKTATGAPKAKETTSAVASAEAVAAEPLVPSSLAQEIWPKMAVGHLVLAPDYDGGAFTGFWAAAVIGRKGDEVLLRWAGEYADQPEFSRPLTALGLPHPTFRG